MNLDEYIQNATRTESNPDKKIVANKTLLSETLWAFILAGKLLDDHKKLIFYGKEPKGWQHKNELSLLSSRLTALSAWVPNMSGHQEEIEINPRIFHSIIGIATEAAELVEALHKHITGEAPIDLTNVREENGDVNWYQAIFYDTMKQLGFEGSWEEDLEKNIAKLRSRYPEKFTSEKAINRNVEEEMKHYEDKDEG